LNTAFGVLLLIPLGLLQVTWVSGAAGLYPNLVLAAVVAWTCLRGPRSALPWAVAGGLICDAGSWGPLGPRALAMLAAVYCVGLLQRALDLDRLLLLAACGGGGTIVYALVLLALGAVQGQVPDPREAAWLVLAEAVCNAVLVPLAGLSLRRLRDLRWPQTSASEA
jgi:rod shape-determining protein MreD